MALKETTLFVLIHIAVVNMDGVEPPMHIVAQGVNQVRVQAVSVSLFVISREELLHIFWILFMLLQYYGLNFSTLI